ncbi:hypothetical protein [Chengkuizengella marina]|uniref:Uncharacterized protein n=1 Tax=Chengkuizengella marina TaxID=2507566 RepID=A0A6N9Q2E7_9BACL|nr:hypothetical protein [Chengkuizengella marina]NBI28890.1 hypothetical protein [Chengkuizengella marina]
MKKTIASLLTLIILALVFVTFSVYGKQDNYKESYNSEKNKFAQNYLLTKNRKDTLNICVESYSSLVNTESIKNKVVNSIEKDLRKHVRWNIQGLDKFKIDVSQKYSFDPILLQPNKNHVFFSGDLDSIRIVEEESNERVGIFIVDHSVINKHFNDTVSRLTPEEFLIDKITNEALEVTTGIYVTSEEFETQEFIDQFKYVLGLDILLIN